MAKSVSGSTFAAEIAQLSPAAYASAVLDAAESSAVNWPMTLVPVPLPGGEDLEVVVADDYFAIGTETDYVRTPLDAPTAQTLGDRLGFILPTPRLVDLIWIAAPVKLRPVTGGELTPPIAIGTAEQDSPSAFVRHDAKVTAQLAGRDGLRAGHKKDVVLSNLLLNAPTPPAPPAHPFPNYGWDAVVIYGWHYDPADPKKGACAKFPATPGLCPIQGVSDVHERSYRDYAHGVRMLSPMARLNGEVVELGPLLTSAKYGPHLNAGAPLKVLRYSLTGGKPPPGSTCLGIGGDCKPPGAPAGGGTSNAVRALAGVAGVGAVTLGVWAARQRGWI